MPIIELGAAVLFLMLGVGILAYTWRWETIATKATGYFPSVHQWGNWIETLRAGLVCLVIGIALIGDICHW